MTRIQKLFGITDAKFRNTLDLSSSDLHTLQHAPQEHFLVYAASCGLGYHIGGEFKSLRGQCLLKAMRQDDVSSAYRLFAHELRDMGYGT